MLGKDNCELCNNVVESLCSYLHIICPQDPSPLCQRFFCNGQNMRLIPLLTRFCNIFLSARSEKSQGTSCRERYL
jgi:hypothetical protein